MTDANDTGFTLIEVLAALLIFSLAIVGLTASGTHSAKAVSIMDQKMLAGIVADNVLTNARYERLQVGTRSGSEDQMSRRYDWELLTQTTDVEGFWRMTVSVRSDNGEQVLISRSAYRTNDVGARQPSAPRPPGGGEE